MKEKVISRSEDPFGLGDNKNKSVFLVLSKVLIDSLELLQPLI